MSAIIYRSACEPGGICHELGNRKPLPPDVAYVRISVRYYDIFVYTGWHTYLTAAGRECLGGRGISHWVRYSARNPFGLLDLFPVRDPSESLLPVTDYHRWMPLFAAQHQRGTFDGQPRGIAYCWAWCEEQSVRELFRS